MKARLYLLRRTDGRRWNGQWMVHFGVNIEFMPSWYDSQARHDFARCWSDRLRNGVGVINASQTAHTRARAGLRRRGITADPIVTMIESFDRAMGVRTYAGA